MALHVYFAAVQIRSPRASRLPLVADVGDVSDASPVESVMLAGIGTAFAAASGLMKATVIIGGLVTLSGLAYCAVDAIGDSRETKLRKEALEDRLKTIEDSNDRKTALVNLPRFAKIWCAADGVGTPCCKPDAVKHLRCTHDPASGDKRPD